MESRIFSSTPKVLNPKRAALVKAIGLSCSTNKRLVLIDLWSGGCLVGGT